jgi:hypothetical protein
MQFSIRPVQHEMAGPLSGRPTAFFGCMYYAALRPQEVTDPRRSNLVSLPERDGAT